MRVLTRAADGSPEFGAAPGVFWYVAGVTGATDFAWTRSVFASGFEPTTWQAIPFTNVSFGAKALPELDRSRHSIRTCVADGCCPKAAVAKQANTTRAEQVLTVFPSDGSLRGDS